MRVAVAANDTGMDAKIAGFLSKLFLVGHHAFAALY